MRFLIPAALLGSFLVTGYAQQPAPLKILFLGDNGHHRPADRFAQLKPVFDDRQIELTYTDRLDDLNPETLAGYDGLIVFANQDVISQDQERALLDYVQSGGGFIPLHCASYCFRNSEAYVALVGAQFQKHGGEVFGTVIEEPEHPIMKGFSGFRSWDETYVHSLENPDREILEFRVEGMQADGRDAEPYTWVRKFSEGRIFYTAWGHDERTWGNPGFVNLVERGLRWACGGDPAIVADFHQRTPFEMPAMTQLPEGPEPFEYAEVGNKIPNYLVSDQWGDQGEPLSTMQLPLWPTESLRRYVTPLGFDLELYASEDSLGAKPIAMSWDHRGRLWLCLTVDYPNELRVPGQGNDKVVICEDTDGDQVADKFTTFAEKLSIPTAITQYGNGVIVQDGVRTLYLEDTNGDDVADLTKVLITGWELGDTHGGVSNLRYAPDNWIWGMQGYNDSRPEFAGGTTERFRMGFFRFKLDQASPPNVTDLEFIRSTNNNTWGLGFSEEGLVFGSTANRNPSVFMPIANRYYERVLGWGPDQLGTIADSHLFAPITDKVRQVDQHGGYTAGAGHSLYTARRYPQTWWNRTAFVNGPTGHLTGVFVLEPSGAGFTSYSPGNLVASDDEWAAPIMAEVGPDGNVWVLDWYNYIVQHNPTPQGFTTGKGNAYESDLRDKKHGRILRVTHVNADADAAPTLSIDDPDSLLKTLGHDNMLWRLHAQRLLVQRDGLDVVPGLTKWLDDRSVDAIGLNGGVMHALWTLDGLGVLDGKNLELTEKVQQVLNHPAAGVRRAAVQTLPRTVETVAAILEHELATDADAQVRLAAMLKLSDISSLPSDQELEVGRMLFDLVGRADIMNDRWLSDAVSSAAAMHAGGFVAAAVAVHKTPSDQAANVIRRVAEHLARGNDPAEINAMLTRLQTASPEVAAPVFAGLLAGVPTNGTVSLTPESEQALLALADRLPANELSQLIAVASRFGSNAFETYAQKVSESILETLNDLDANDPVRLRAAVRLVSLLPESDDVVSSILETIDLQMDPATAQAMIQSLRGSRASGVAGMLLDTLSEWTPAVRETAIRLLLSRPEWTRPLVTSLEAGDMAMNDLALDQRQSLVAHPDAGIRAAATELMRTGGGLPNSDRAAVIEKYLASTHNRGNPDRGRELYKEHCGKCHKHGDLGQEVGPELTGMAVHPKEELLIHILDPSRSVEGNYRSYTVLTAEGRVLTGMLAGETKTTVELIDTTSKREVIPRADIEQINASKNSVMPEGFEAQLDGPAMTDLLEFLTTRGKYLPLDLRKVATLPSDRPMFYGGGGEVLMLDSWAPIEVNGVPFSLIAPAEGRVPNVVMLYGPLGKVPPTLPKQVVIPVGGTVKAIHILGGVGGWNAQSARPDGQPVMNLKIFYQDGSTEDHLLKDGEHFADYIGAFEVPGSTAALKTVQGYQVRYLSVTPDQPEKAIDSLQLIKQDHASSPITLAITIEGE